MLPTNTSRDVGMVDGVSGRVEQIKLNIQGLPKRS